MRYLSGSDYIKGDFSSYPSFSSREKNTLIAPSLAGEANNNQNVVHLSTGSSKALLCPKAS